MSLLQRDENVSKCLVCGAWVYKAELCATCQRILAEGIASWNAVHHA